MKKILIALIIAALLLAAVGCGLAKSTVEKVEAALADEPVAEAPVEEPVAEPVEEPVEEPVAEPAEEPAEVPAEASADEISTVIQLTRCELGRVTGGLFFKPVDADIMIALNGVTDETVQLSDPTTLTNPMVFTLAYTLAEEGEHDIEVSIVMPDGSRMFKCVYAVSLGSTAEENTLDACMLVPVADAGLYTASLLIDGQLAATATLTVD